MRNRLGNCGHGQMTIFVSQVGGFTLIRRCTSSCGTTIVVLSLKNTLSPEGTSLYSTTSHHWPSTRASIGSFTDVAILCIFVVITHVPINALKHTQTLTRSPVFAYVYEILCSRFGQSRTQKQVPRFPRFSLCQMMWPV